MCLLNSDSWTAITYKISVWKRSWIHTCSSITCSTIGTPIKRMYYDIGYRWLFRTLASLMRTNLITCLWTPCKSQRSGVKLNWISYSLKNFPRNLIVRKAPISILYIRDVYSANLIHYLARRTRISPLKCVAPALEKYCTCRKSASGKTRHVQIDLCTRNVCRWKNAFVVSI